MSKLTRLNRLVRRSFKHLNRVQTGSAFVRHYFIVQAHANEARLAREVQLTQAKQREYVAVSF